MRRYFIPANFATEGKVGNFPIRNIIETAFILFIIGVPLVGYVPLPVKAKLCVCIIVLGILGFAGLRGINGLSLFSFLADFLAFSRNRRVYGKPDNADRIGRGKRLVKKKNRMIRLQKKQEKKQQKTDKKESRRARRRGEDD
ncbi:MAG: hypothetical protein LUE14_04600 [Clostridiales bacterium]|nr:hypothetical protein [Clostridiales bacterium]